MTDLAQTNVQLIAQLAAREWTDDDLRRLRAAYELCMWLFSGQFRANGKTQIAHHVGVASALAGVGARPELVVAGLVHSAYFLGEFGTGRLPVTQEKRDRVTAAVGREVEDLVAGYTDLPWDAAAVQRFTDEAGSAGPVRRDLVAMRIANEIDELADGAMRFSADHHGPDLLGAAGIEKFVALADAMGHVALGKRLREAYASGTAMSVPDVLYSAEDNTVFVPPASYRRRLHVVIQDSSIGHELAERVPGARRAAEYVRRKLR
jgi:hypothetical protein